MSQSLRSFRDGQRVTVIAAAHQLHGRTGTVVRMRRGDDGAWVRMDERLPPNLVLFADERARNALLYPDECAEARP